MKVLTVLWYEFRIFKRKFWTITSGAMISPLLYLIAFGWGLGQNVVIDGMSYMRFVVPGIVAMTTMTVSFGTVANSLNISRTYDKTFEEFITAPIHMWEYAAGKIIGGSIRGLYSAVLIFIASLFFRETLIITPYVILIAVLNCLVFAALGFMIGMIIDSHMEMNKFNSFIITPMSFLCGTFFPVDKVPVILREVISFLPLTQAATGMRNTDFSAVNPWISPCVLVIYLIIFFVISIKLCTNAE